jgi:hypothetical protein
MVCSSGACYPGGRSWSAARTSDNGKIMEIPYLEIVNPQVDAVCATDAAA